MKTLYELTVDKKIKIKFNMIKEKNFPAPSNVYKFINKDIKSVLRTLYKKGIFSLDYVIDDTELGFRIDITKSRTEEFVNSLFIFDAIALRFNCSVEAISVTIV